MEDSRTSAERVKAARAVNAKVQAWSAPSCSFCMFVLDVYPTLENVGKRDGDMIRVHLQNVHGLQPEITV
jgi:hypothetical protein